MKISMIAAMNAIRVIGVNGGLPKWNAPGDLKRFKALTTSKVIVMGRKTYESIGKPLPHRLNLVVSRTMPREKDSVMHCTNGIFIARTLKEALFFAGDLAEQESMGDPNELMVIGGGEIYAQALPLATKLYLTKVNDFQDGDVFFPPLDEKEWRVVAEEVTPTHTFVDMERV